MIHVLTQLHCAAQCEEEADLDGSCCAGPGMEADQSAGSLRFGTQGRAGWRLRRAGWRVALWKWQKGGIAEECLKAERPDSGSRCAVHRQRGWLQCHD